MGIGGKKIQVIIISVIVILTGIGTVVLLNLEKVQEIYENLIGDEESDGEEDLNGPDIPDEPPGLGKPIHQALQTLLSSSSARSIGSMTTVVSSDSEFFPLIGTPIATGYKGMVKDASPLLISSGSASEFLEIYNNTSIITLGEVGGVNCDFSFPGNEKTASLEAAKQIWSYSSGALVIEKSKEGYEIGVAATALASYLNIPVIVTNVMDEVVTKTLSGLGVSYTLICGNLGGYGETYYLSTLNDVIDLICDFLKARLGKISYVTITNSEDVHTDYGIAKISSLAPYLSASREGLVLNCPQPRLSSTIFGETEENIANSANEVNLRIKSDLDTLLGKFKNLGMYSSYVTNSPYLAILGDPYSIPHYYFENSNPSTSSGADDAWIATDDYYADLDNEPLNVELAVGRVLALSPGGISALISRSIFYDQYKEQWEADSRVNDIKGAQWKDTAYAAKGDDWNGAILVMTRDYWEEVNYLQNQGYTVHTTQRRESGATVSQDILHYYSSSNIIYVIAHGSSDGYQIVDGIEASSVKSWDMGPSVQILTSCSAARTDVPDIENTISLTFIEVGVNAYVGGSRTESSADSPALSANAVEQMVSLDETVGIACRNAKNEFLENDDSIEHSAMRVLYADPAFDPYQP